MVKKLSETEAKKILGEMPNMENQEHIQIKLLLKLVLISHLFGEHGLHNLVLRLNS